MKSRLTHVVLVVIGVALPAWGVVDAWQASAGLGEVFPWWVALVGFVGAACGFLAQAEHFIPGLGDEASTSRLILHRIGAVAAIASPAVASLASSVPAGSRTAFWLGAFAQLACNLSTAFGSSAPKVASILALVLGASLVGAPARADAVDPDWPVIKFGNWTCQFAFGLTVSQFNLTTKTYEKGVALGGGYGCTWRGGKIPLGIVGYGGVGVWENAPNALQVDLLLNAADYAAAGPGVALFKDPVDGQVTMQWLLNLKANLNVGAGVAGLFTQVNRARSTSATPGGCQ